MTYAGKRRVQDMNKQMRAVVANGSGGTEVLVIGGLRPVG
jgi:hypothetical protein